jgi:hypothetical protein
MKRYEYKTHKEYLKEYELNKLGTEGWELISYAVIYVTHAGQIKQHYIFKRELSI